MAGAGGSKSEIRLTPRALPQRGAQTLVRLPWLSSRVAPLRSSLEQLR